MNKRALFYRLIALFPSLLCFSILVFFLSRIGPNNHLENYSRIASRGNNPGAIEEKKMEMEIIETLGLNKPLFYFSLNNCNTLRDDFPFNKISDKKKWQDLVYRLNNKEGVLKFTNDLLKYSKVYPELSSLYSTTNTKAINAFLLAHSEKAYSKALVKSCGENLKYKNSLNKLLPSLQWNGLNNQYHLWISGFIAGDWGKSLVSGRPVRKSIGSAMTITLVFGSLSLIFSLLISIPLATIAALNPNSRLDNTLNSIFFTFHSIPNFWLGTLLILFLTNPIYLDWFPSFGFPTYEDSFQFIKNIPYMVLPLICWTYSSLAILYRHMRAAIIDELKKPYVQVAKAKGLANKTVLWKHAFSNAKFPLITLIGIAVPSILSGSFVVEHLFSLPGMGELSLTAFQSKDFPLIYALLLLSGLITFLAMLVSDLLYLYSNPKLSK